MGDRGARGGRESVKVTLAIAAKDHAPGTNILDRETESVKFNGTRIVASELTNGKNIANERRNN